LRALPKPTYAELEPWLTAEPALRRRFPKRFGARAAEPEFRKALIAHLSSHREWQPVLFPPEINAKVQSQVQVPRRSPYPPITVITRGPR